MSTEFMECEAFSVSYNIMGVATVTYTLIHKTPQPTGITSSVSAGDQRFHGCVISVSTSPIPRTNYYETNVTLLATTDM